MRKPKFKVWDNVDHMSKPFTLNELQAELVQFDCACPVMQFTGLKDKNSNEIYEHDIAKISVGGHKSVNAKVIFECGSFWLYSIDLPLVFDSDIDGMVRLSTLCLELEGFELNQLHQLEVIGNIHQNPELLEQDDE